MTEDPKAYTAKEGLMILIKGFLDTQQGSEPFGDYDATMKALRERHQESMAYVEEPLTGIANHLFEVSDQAHFVFQVLNWKIYYLAKGLGHAIETENPMTLAINARSLLEHIATCSSVGRRIQKLESDLDGQQSEKKILASLESMQSYLKRAYYGSSSGESDREVTVIHINDALRDLEKEISNARELYDSLSEFVHPNYGSNRLVSSGELASGHLKLSEELNRELLDRLRRICSYCFIYLKNNITGHFAGPLRLQAILELCFVRGVKLSTVFAKKQPKPTGDGKSKETAYFFPKARTAPEAMKLQNEFLKSEGLEVTGLKQSGGFKEDFIYDVYPTTIGNIWFKAPVGENLVHE